ncbi:hypothetical protein L5515_016857 [Caenorhabditis briggsae]|uniref:Uncharacterized protein n=1 Tax=Caenorhabditis briggsae TaxID=6238 RepID=A0AAE9JRV3_CAEBR|nr:hypothetical protein L5515_016857 [Caenorhabditis briggsae]
MLKRDVPLGAIPRIRQGQGAESRGTMLQHEVQNGVVQLHSPRASERHPEKIRMQHKESDSSKRWSEELLLFRMPVNHRVSDLTMHL